MKTITSISIIFCMVVLINTNGFAQEIPLIRFKTIFAKTHTVTNKKQKLLYVPLYNEPIKLNPLVRTNNAKQNAMAQILKWDMKFKFRLSDNLSIIFSYN